MFPKFLRIAAVGDVISKELENGTTISEIFTYTLLVEQINVLSLALGFSYEFVYPDIPYDYGLQDSNGSWTGIMGMVHRGEADMTLGGVSLYENAFKAFHLSYPTDIVQITFITKKHEYVPDPAVFLHPFSMQVWLSILACLFIMPFVFGGLMRKKLSPVTLFSSTLRSLVGQGLEFEPRKPREYFLLSFWVLSSALVGYFYASVLLSFVTFPSLEGLRTIEDLGKGIQDGKYKATTYRSTFYGANFLNSTNPSLQTIGHSLVNSNGSNNFILDLEDFSYGRKTAFVGLKQSFLSFKDVYFISEDNFFSLNCGMATHKDFCCKSKLDEAIHHGWAAGLFQKLLSDDNLRQFLKASKLYEKYWLKSPTEDKLTMELFKVPLLFLMVSHAMAILVLLIEIFVAKYSEDPPTTRVRIRRIPIKRRKNRDRFRRTR